MSLFRRILARQDLTSSVTLASYRLRKAPACAYSYNTCKMRLSWTLLPLVACVAEAASDTGHLVIFDSVNAVNAAQRTISPEAARLIVASRLGLDQYHELGSASRDTIAAVNDFTAGNQLFAS